MSKIFNKKKININQEFTCYYCGAKIIDVNRKRCPNCYVILDPNNYINWRNSFCGFLCLLCLFPIFIVILITVFFI